MNLSTVYPTGSKQRILALDFLRGFAILGILIMNIQSFALPRAAYLNPVAYGDLAGINKWVWIFSHILADQKFMTLFSILFGAGIVMITQKAETISLRSAGLYYRRTFWLLIIGLIHAHFIWYGDILVIYAICALFAFMFRKKRPRNLLIIGLLMIFVHTILYVFIGSAIDYVPPDSIEAIKNVWLPDAKSINTEIMMVRGSLMEQIRHNSQEAIIMETIVFFIILLWRAGGLMLVGMALYKLGVLTAKRSSQFYTKGLIISFLIGFPLIIYGVFKNFQMDWSFDYSMYLGSQFNYIGSLFVSFGYLCAIMLIALSNTMPWLKNRLAAVGQMALTNYLAQSVICVFIFYGVGFRLFGQLERLTLIYFVIAIWLIQILWSRPWLNRYRFGPMEWIWRSLTYKKIQAFKK